jgi:uncharacterized protein (DUF305 family)
MSANPNTPSRHATQSGASRDDDPRGRTSQRTILSQMAEAKRAMIPHHSLAITRSERFQNQDLRVCELAVEISEAQRREIDEMDWLIRDIEENGFVTTAEEAEAREVPDFPVSADRRCSSE